MPPVMVEELVTMCAVDPGLSQRRPDRRDKALLGFLPSKCMVLDDGVMCRGLTGSGEDPE